MLNDKPNKHGISFPDKDLLTWYHVVDPAFARNYVAIWAGVSEDEEIFIRRSGRIEIPTESGHCSGIPNGERGQLRRS